MRVISKQELADTPAGTLLATNDGQDAPWKMFILDDVMMDGERVSDFFMMDPLDGGLSREGLFCDDDTYIIFDPEDVIEIIQRLTACDQMIKHCVR